MTTSFGKSFFAFLSSLLSWGFPISRESWLASIGNVDNLSYHTSGIERYPLFILALWPFVLLLSIPVAIWCRFTSPHNQIARLLAILLLIVAQVAGIWSLALLSIAGVVLLADTLLIIKNMVITRRKLPADD